tara:strand:- start:3201 stop:3872 length:672 start_codon:yes stop_codon:yes gene_type:complete
MIEENKIKETWFNVPDYVGLYEYSNLHNIRSVDRKHTRGKVLKWTDENGKKSVILRKDKEPKYYPLSKLIKIINKKELNSILKHVEGLSGDNIRTDDRDRKFVFLRVVFTELALSNLDIKPNEVMEFLGRNRCTSYHYKKITKEVLKMGYYNEIYTLYKNLHNENGDKIKKEIPLTDNEKMYRKLTDNERDIYDDRVKVILRMMPSNQTRKEVDKYEQINCSA